MLHRARQQELRGLPHSLAAAGVAAWDDAATGARGLDGRHHLTASDGALRREGAVLDRREELSFPDRFAAPGVPQAPPRDRWHRVVLGMLRRQRACTAGLQGPGDQRAMGDGAAARNCNRGRFRSNEGSSFSRGGGSCAGVGTDASCTTPHVVKHSAAISAAPPCVSLFELGEQFGIAPSLRPKLTIPSCNRTTQALSSASKAATRRQNDTEAIRARMQHLTYA